MSLQLTRKEEFLICVALYLRNFYFPYEVEKIIRNEEQFKSIDILNDELDYFGLTLNDFDFENN